MLGVRTFKLIFLNVSTVILSIYTVMYNTTVNCFKFGLKLSIHPIVCKD